MPTLENFGIALGPLREKDWDLAKERDALQNHKAKRGIFCEKCGHWQSVFLQADDKDGRRCPTPNPGADGDAPVKKKMRRRSHRGRYTRKIPRMLLGNVLCVLRSEIPEFWEDERLRPAVLL
jgi:hypothetical protein